MALNSYANLKTSIINWSNRDDLAPLVDDFIDLAESEMYAGNERAPGLRIRGMELSSAITVSGRTATLPTNYVQPRSVIYVVGGQSRRVDMLAPQSQKIKSGAGTPFNFTIRDNIEFDRTPTGTVTLEYYGSATALSTSITSNTVLSRFPQIYLFGSLVQAFRYAEDEEEEAKYQRRFESSILGANAQDRSGRYLAPAGRVRGLTP